MEPKVEFDFDKWDEQASVSSSESVDSEIERYAEYYGPFARDDEAPILRKPRYYQPSRSETGHLVIHVNIHPLDEWTEEDAARDDIEARTRSSRVPQCPQETEYINRLFYGVNQRVMEIRAARNRVLEQVRELIPLRQTHAEVMSMLTGDHPMLQLNAGTVTLVEEQPPDESTQTPTLENPEVMREVADEPRPATRVLRTLETMREHGPLTIMDVLKLTHKSH